VLAFVGVATIVGQSHGGATLRGDLLMLASVVVWVVYSFLTRRMAEAYPASVVAYRTILWGVATLTPLAVVELALVGPPRPSSASLAALAFLGIFCSAIAYLWWARALQVLGVTTANSLVYGIPLVAVAAGVVLLDEPLTARVVGGGLLVVAGVVLANLPFGGVGAPRRPLPG
jgi:drug/metabolite transporter (DMT)-like permease